METNRRIALKVDCDTFEGTKTGIPNLLDAFDKAGIKASFFFTLGPDRSGRAIRRIFTQKGFLRKMIRSNAVSLYGPKTMLYGTLLPAPIIGRKLKDVMRSVAQSGHEAGVHGWDHIRWHDHLGKMEKRQIEGEYSKAHNAFEEIFGKKAHSSAAPGWHSTHTFLWIQDSYKLLYASNTRLGQPHFPSEGKYSYKTLEIPTTLPTWDEALTAHEFQDRRKLLEFFCASIHGIEVHTIHTEVEGMAYLPLFRRQLEFWKADGIQFITLEQYAKELLAERDRVPVRTLTRVSLPNRAGLVSSSEPVPQAALAS